VLILTKYASQCHLMDVSCTCHYWCMQDATWRSRCLPSHSLLPFRSYLNSSARITDWKLGFKHPELWKYSGSRPEWI